jgi:uncharacterized membrane protein
VITIFVFLALIAAILGLKLLLSPHQPSNDELLIAIVLLAGALTYFWNRSSFRGINSN